ncbi:hypothetical protein BGY98DRAFT_1099750 [Russula aff. rugulosa BPL654]|nr:hypothetical protein BGY98DRAFT_1099750 [Russula aff. rugulosa BPL654]
MPGAPIHTWRDLLLPNEQDTHHVILSQVTEGQRTAITSSFSLLAWDPERLPSAAHLFEDLPSRMHEHLRVIIDQHFSDQAARTSFKNRQGRSITPDHVIESLRDNCADYTFYLSYETGTRTITEYLSCSVKVVYAALTGNFLDVQGQEPSSNGAVITDRVFQFDDGIKILWAEKSSRAFDRFIGELMEQMRDRSAVELCIEPVATTYRGYKAILGKLGYHASEIQPRVRWAIVFSGLHYMIIYIPRTPGRPQMYCSPVMQFCLRPDEEQEPAIRPPIWSILVYILLVETLNIDDDNLRKRFGLVVPMEDPDLGSKIDTRVCKSSESGRTTELQLQAAGSITVQCLDAYPMELLLVSASHSHQAKKPDHPFIHLDRRLVASRSSVFASSKSHVVVEFAAVPKRDKAELVERLSDEKAAYEKLNRIAGWIIPRLYGEYEWHGGRALVLSDEGRSLSHLEDFKSLPLIERLILFVEMYCIHYLGVEHGL